MYVRSQRHGGCAIACASNSRVHSVASRRWLLVLRLLALSSVWALHVNICRSPLSPLAILWHRFILGVGVVWKFCDDVPGVEQTWEESQAAEENVYHRVGRADAALYPYGDGGEEDGDEAEEYIGSAHIERREGVPIVRIRVML